MNRGGGASTRVAHWAVALLVCAGFAVVHTWPLAREPGTLCRNDNSDAQVLEWIVAWVAHQLPRDPLNLFQGNIFYPSRDALAFSEPMIVPAVMAGPSLWLGGSAVLAFNLLILIGFTLTAFATYAVMHAWTGDRLAAFLAGSLFAFNAHTLTHLVHVQALHAYGLPIALLLTDRVIAAPRPRTAVTLGACMAMMAYTSGYIALFGLLMTAVAMTVSVRRWALDAARVIPMFALAGVTAAILTMPVLIPYRRVAAEQHMVRSLEEIANYSASIAAYLAAPGRIHFSTWSADAFNHPVDPLFPGVVAMIMAVVGLYFAVRGAERARVTLLAAIGAAGLVLSFGTATPIYGWLYDVLPLMQTVRAASRFGTLFLLAIALLAGFGLAGLRRASGHRRMLTVLALATIVLVNVETLRAPFFYRRWTGIPTIYKILAQQPDAVLAEMPFYPGAAGFQNAEYVLNSTAHWRPLLNGYSSYAPAGYAERAARLSRFPRDEAFPPMTAAGVTHIMVHPARFGGREPFLIEELSARPDLRLVSVDVKTGIRLYKYSPLVQPATAPSGGRR